MIRGGAAHRVITRQRGFTLIELLAVCALVVLVLSMTIPNLRGLYHNDPLSRTARLVERAVERAQTMAVESDQAVPVLIDGAAQRVLIGLEGSGFTVALPEAVTIAPVQGGAPLAGSPGSIMAWVNERGMIEPLELVVSGGDRELLLSFSPFVAPRISTYAGPAGARSPQPVVSAARIN